MKKWWIIIFYLFILVIGVINREVVIEWIRNSELSYFNLILLLSILIATIPIIPFTIFGGLMGIKYGLLLGLFVNWLGALSAAVIYYTCARFLLSDFFGKRVVNLPKIDRFQSLIKRNAFMAVLLVRLVPIVPPPIVNVYSAISEIPFFVYFLSTAIGYIPPMFIITFGGHQVFSDFHSFLAGLSLYGLFLVIVLAFYRIWVKGKVRFN